MKSREGVCPECGSKGRMTEERIKGIQTGDLICPKCNFVGHKADFRTNTSRIVSEKETDDN